jgi:hypothetical protein
MKRMASIFGLLLRKERDHMAKMLNLGCCLGLLMMTMGCINGPLRYKALGFRRSATVEMTTRASPAWKVAAAPAGGVIDLIVVVLDTVATPLIAIPIAFELMGPCPQATTRENVVVKTLTAPLWFPISYVFNGFGMPFREQAFYGEWFGQESQLFLEKTHETTDGVAKDAAEHEAGCLP